MAHDITISNFSDSVKYKYETSENFKNGDKIDVEVSYNEKFAETLGLKARTLNLPQRLRG